MSIGSGHTGEPGHVWVTGERRRTPVAMQSQLEREGKQRPALLSGALLCQACRQLWPGNGPCPNPPRGAR